jgi:heat shock protein HslJ
MKLLVTVGICVGLAGASLAAVQQGSTESSATQLRPPDPPRLQDTYWKLVAVGDSTPADQPGGREPHIIFHTTGGSLTGNDGCNSIRATYTQDGANVKIGVVIMGTLINCPILDRLDRRFRESLVMTRGWTIVDSELTLLDEDDKPLARFVARVDR